MGVCVWSHKVSVGCSWALVQVREENMRKAAVAAAKPKREVAKEPTAREKALQVCAGLGCAWPVSCACSCTVPGHVCAEKQGACVGFITLASGVSCCR